MYFQDFFAPNNVRIGHYHLPVKPAGAQQCRVQHIRAVGGGDENNALIGLKPVHLDKQLVQCLLALVIATAQTGTTMATHRVNLVDENNARRIGFSLLEHVTHAACSNANKHFDKIRTGN